LDTHEAEDVGADGAVAAGMCGAQRGQVVALRQRWLFGVVGEPAGESAEFGGYCVQSFADVLGVGGVVEHRHH
jgi:hypothetical protein